MGYAIGGSELSPAVVFNRTLGLRAKLDSDYLKFGYGTAYYYDGYTIVSKLYVKNEDDKRDFNKYSTAWEKMHATISFGWIATPLVDANILVVGYRGQFRSDEIFVKSEDARVSEFGVSGVSEFIERGVEVFADAILRDEYLSRGYRNDLAIPEVIWDVLTDPEGRVVAVLGARDVPNVEASWVTPLDLIAIPRLIFGLGKGAVALITGALARRAARRAAARELTEVIPFAFRRTGALTAEDMQAHLDDVIANRPELARLLGAAGTDGEVLRRQVYKALEDWQYLYGRNVMRVPNGFVQTWRGNENLLTLEGDLLFVEEQVLDGTREIQVFEWGTGRELGTRSIDAEESTARFLYRQVTHELSADALVGHGGDIGQYLAYTTGVGGFIYNALFLLENGIRGGNVHRIATAL